MINILLLLVTVVRIVIYALQVFLIVRAVLSWFPGNAGGALGDFVYMITEPLVLFVRKNIILRIRPLRELPIDLSLFFALIILEILLMFL